MDKATKVAAAAAAKTINSSGSTSHPPDDRTKDWTCASCDNSNFEWRTECHTCHEAKETSKAETSSYTPIVEKPCDVRIMTTFKTTKCKDPACLSLSSSRECPHFHNDGDRRRNPYAIQYAPDMCDTKPKGAKGKFNHTMCMEGDACLFSHNVFEQMFHPLRYKKFPCRFRGPLSGKNLCPNAAKVCAFIHGLEDSRVPKDVTKLKASTAAAAAASTAPAPAASRTAAVVRTEVTTNAVDKTMPALKVASPVAVSSYVPSPTPTSPPTRNQQALSPTPPTTTKTGATTENSNSKVMPDMPREYCCCLSKKLMEDPVLAADGMTYERAVIEAYFQNCRDSQRDIVSPHNGGPLVHTFLAPNIAIRILIEDWCSGNLPSQS